MNKALVQGKLIRDAKSNQINDNLFVCSFTLLVETQKGPKNNRTTEKLYVPVSLWNKMAQQYAGSLKKDTEVKVGGRIKYKQYTNKEGQQRDFWEIVAKDFEVVNNVAQEPPRPVQTQAPFVGESDFDDDLPF